jgi:hypothetical protein
MLALRNKDGEVFASIGGLAHQARVDRDKTAEAIAKFLEPEDDSASRDDGRRIEEIPGGWRLLNHDRIKEEAKAANKTTYMANYMKEKRDREKLARSLPMAGEQEYLSAFKRGASEEELSAIVAKYQSTNS